MLPLGDLVGFGHQVRYGVQEVITGFVIRREVFELCILALHVGVLRSRLRYLILKGQDVGVVQKLLVCLLQRFLYPGELGILAVDDGPSRSRVFAAVALPQVASAPTGG